MPDDVGGNELSDPVDVAGPKGVGRLAVGAGVRVLDRHGADRSPDPLLRNGVAGSLTTGSARHSRPVRLVMTPCLQVCPGVHGRPPRSRNPRNLGDLSVCQSVRRRPWTSEGPWHPLWHATAFGRPPDARGKLYLLLDQWVHLAAEVLAADAATIRRIPVLNLINSALHAPAAASVRLRWSTEDSSMRSPSSPRR